MQGDLFSSPLYLVTDESQDLKTLAFVVEGAIRAKVGAIQIREKHGDIRKFLAKAEQTKRQLEGTGIPLIINDRIDVALAIDADGLHLGQSDMPVLLARKLLGNHKIIGLSVESNQQLDDAQAYPVDYLGISAVFPTSTKTNLLHYWGIEGLKHAYSVSKKPLVAIGGITLENIGQIANTKVQSIALVSAICQAPSPYEACMKLTQAIQTKS